jgi:hypothetical protein
MFKTLLIAVSLVSLNAPLGFAQEPIQFANTPWGAGKAQTKANFVAAGWAFDKEDAEGDLQFSGTVPTLDEPAVIFAFFSPDEKLVKVQVNIFPPEHRALTVYRSVQDVLIEMYGRPRRDIEHYTYPYDDDGGAIGHETAAISMGKGIVASLWGNGGTEGGLVLNITEKLLDQINYESGSWATELSRRKKALTP